MRRKKGSLLAIELSVLEAGIEVRNRTATEFYGFLIAKEIAEREGARRMTAHGTLYKALSRMEDLGLLVSRWEDPFVAAEENRPRRRLYEVTPQGQQELTNARTTGATTLDLSGVAGT